MLICNTWVKTSTCRGLVNSPLLSRRYCLTSKFSRTAIKIKANLVDGSETYPSSTRGKNPLVAVLEVPRVIWRKTLQPLSNFGFGQRSIWEGGVGLFIVSGVALTALTLAWLRGFYVRSGLQKYQVVFEFAQACGICVGTPVRIRGVTVGNVTRVNSSLKSIDANIEVEDDKVIIPRNSLVEVNQSGLLMETLIDITPQDPLPTPSVGPRHLDCHKEGLILCDKEKMKGQQGISLDSLVGIFTRLGREMEEIGVKRSYMLGEKIVSIVQEAQPLLAKVEILVEDIRPLLVEVRDSDVLKDVEVMTRSLAEATEELRRLRSSMLTPENIEIFRRSIFTLVCTLKNLESISSDISVFTSDAAARENMKMLIKSLSRML
ncbi:Protein trigalactosyldiacylglycerol 2, chloroplastic [Apostasia shenzhenica]|uniref:Protein trigalactosyldiacylglycerol 2, chloroplastic n=1 Tax=Apostasia shenzhenica TaxID=1088818 RepID=A0A2I0B5T4_9ASPA|nr:Protein trigalactosyldiacylglycerol 2, chloroplastic [Apostasia shenzhenica]